MLAKVYTWDEAGLEVHEHELVLFDERFGPSMELLLGRISYLLEEKFDHPHDSFNIGYRQLGDVHILDGLFGRDMPYHIYYDAVDPGRARLLAEIELIAGRTSESEVY